MGKRQDARQDGNISLRENMKDIMDALHRAALDMKYVLMYTIHQALKTIGARKERLYRKKNLNNLRRSKAIDGFAG